MRCICLVACLVMLASSAFADTLKLDPPDPRLDKKITLEVSHAKLRDVATSLSKQSGVEIKAGTSARDWRVRQQHVTFSAKDMPLGAILDELAKLHGYHLSREGKDKEWTYTIWQDKKSRDLEAEMITAEQEAGAQRAKETRQAMTDLAKKAAGMTPEEAQKLRDKDPNLAYLGGTKSGRAYSQIFDSLSQTDMDLMLRGRRVIIPFASLSPELRKAAMDTMANRLIMDDPDAAKLTPLQLVISPLRDDIDGDLVSLGVGGGIALMGMPQGGLTGWNYDSYLGAGDPMSIFMLSKPDSKFGKLFAQALFDIEQGVSKEQVKKTLDSVFGDDQSMAEAAAHDSPAEKTPPTDPALLREVELGKLTSGSGNRSDALSANSVAVHEIAKATGLTVMLESFTKPANAATYLKPGKQPLYKILIGFEKAGYTWKIEDKTLRVRPDDWAVRRSYDVPQSMVAYWTDRLEKQGYLTLDDFASIVSGLTDDQINRTLRYEPDIGYAITMPRGSDHQFSILRFYESLSEDQKTTLATKEGLRFAGLSDKQWDYLAPVIMDRLGGVSIADGFITNRQQEPEKGKSYDLWRFELMVIGDDQQKRALEVDISHLGKEELAPMIEARIQAREKAGAKGDRSVKESSPAK